MLGLCVLFAAEPLAQYFSNQSTIFVGFLVCVWFSSLNRYTTILLRLREVLDVAYFGVCICGVFVCVLHFSVLWFAFSYPLVFLTLLKYIYRYCYSLEQI